jgi:DNA-binding NarL/FixJ family response regulator
MKHPLRVLIVEDEAFAAMYLELELKRLGHQVCGKSATGEGAIQTARREQPEVVFMDIRLAGEIDGVEAAERIREELTSLIYFTTGYDDAETRDRAKEVGAAGFFTKPLDMKAVTLALEQADSGRA